jgi:hypothetical protein
MCSVIENEKIISQELKIQNIILTAISIHFLLIWLIYGICVLYYLFGTKALSCVTKQQFKIT